MMSSLRTRWRFGVATKLYCVAALTFFAVATLAIASYHFAKITEIAARHLYEDGFVGVERSARLETLLEQHRRIVQSAPAEVDRVRIAASQRSLDEVTVKIEELIKIQQGDQNISTHISEALEERITEEFPELVRRAHRVLFYADNFAQDKALEYAAQYALIADIIQNHILTYRDERLRIANSEVSHLFASAASLILWLSVSTLVAFLLLGPLGVVITHGVLSRLRRITAVMLRLAKYDTSAEVPSHADRDEVGDMARAVKVFKANAIELLQRKIQLEQVNLQFDVALNNMTHGLCMFDSSQKLIICNERYVGMYDLPPELAKPGTTLQEILDHRTAIGNYVKATPVQPITESAACIGAGKARAFTQELTDGRTIAISHQPMADCGWVAVHEDITERRRAEAQIAYLARHDALTNLPNRIFFREHLEHAFHQTHRGEGFAILYLDLDQFKNVNDTLGHPVGDMLLKVVAKRLRECVKENDLVARLGGDEFAVIQAEIKKPEESGALAIQLVEAIGRPYDLDGNHIVVGASIGIALAPGDGNDPDQLLKNADMALYRAKADGRRIFRFFEPEMDARLQARRTLELELRRALVNGEFELYYQPVVSFKTNTVSGFEALLRWAHPKRGIVSPGEFIALAEDTGLIIPLGEWVLREACAEAAKWPHEIKVAVNLSPIQFKNPNLAQVVVSALASSGLVANRLELEITESALLEDNETTLEILHQFRALGVRISLDDFGTGYSSLSYLTSFPYDKIKIDQSFIRNMSHRKDCLAIVQAVASLARSLNIVTVAEGVETEDQLEKAKAVGCTEVQGYYFGMPAPAKEVTRTLTLCERRIVIAA